MAVSTKQIASGRLAQNRTADGYVPVSNSSDWFESRSGLTIGSLEHANALTVALAIEKLDIEHMGTPAQELLELHVFESDDLKEWDYAAELTGSATSDQLYSFSWDYGGVPRKKYLRIQFSIDVDPPPDPAPAIPYPLPDPTDHDVWFEGTCWVTTYHKRQ